MDFKYINHEQTISFGRIPNHRQIDSEILTIEIGQGKGQGTSRYCRRPADLNGPTMVATIPDQSSNQIKMVKPVQQLEFIGIPEIVMEGE